MIRVGFRNCKCKNAIMYKEVLYHFICSCKTFQSTVFPSEIYLHNRLIDWETTSLMKVRDFYEENGKRVSHD